MPSSKVDNAGVGSTSAEERPLTTVYAIPVNPAIPTSPTPGGPTSSSGSSQQPTSAIPTPQYNSYSFYQPPESSTATPTPSPSSSSASSSTSTKLAVGITIPLVFLALLGGIFFFVKRRRRKILQEQKRSRYELGFSPAPTHTTFAEKPHKNARSDSRADTLRTNRTQNRATSRNNSHIKRQIDNGMDDQMLTPVNPGLGIEIEISSQTDSHQSGSVQGSKTFHDHPSLSSHPSLNTLPGIRNPERSPRSPRANHIAELASPIDMSGPFYPLNDAIHELGPGKEAEAEAGADPPESGLEPVVPDVAELPDTSRQSIRERDAAALASASELPATKEFYDIGEAVNVASELPTTRKGEHQDAATELPAPILRTESGEGEVEVEGHTAQPQVVNQEITTSWLSSAPNTPTSPKFPS
ncbi:uncharacterized protein BP5553_05551 [Venustampulla echinocandica]|uniref:Uncharacterized protein n=1 Tax=Venustampulla echinocandica TaxID=2656787 RepID=A0A370TRJ3_9HELO|nr:uncharacterized protein BP5553_05551 [Venustampulla echinocandica]RDL38118.1 hypothetical protein BP5553_05551 [Venustampulla echinocandica]